MANIKAQRNHGNFEGEFPRMGITKQFIFVILLVKLSQLYSLYVLLVLTLQYQNKLTDAKENVDTKKDLLTTFSSIYFTSRIFGRSL